MTNEQIENELEHLADGLEHVGSELEHIKASIHKDFDDFRRSLIKTLWLMSLLTAGIILIGVGILIYLK